MLEATKKKKVENKNKTKQNNLFLMSKRSMDLSKGGSEN